MVLWAAAGCQTQWSPLAPYGPTQIPPPATGSARRVDPYYRGAGLAADANASPGRQARFTSQDDPARWAQQQSSADRLADRRNEALSADSLQANENLDWRTPQPESGGANMASPPLLDEAPAAPSSRVRPRFRDR